MKFSVQKLVRFQHCDPAGIVFYPRFFYLLHEVQEDFFAHIGFAEHKLIENGKGLPIVDLKTEFLGMCRNGDPLTITLELTRVGHASIGMQYEIHGASAEPLAGSTLKLKAHGVVVYSDLAAGKGIGMPEDMREALMPFLVNAQHDHA